MKGSAEQEKKKLKRKKSKKRTSGEGKTGRNSWVKGDFEG
mgnify:CR=1 FL=1